MRARPASDLHQMEPNQANVHHIACDTRDLDAVSHANTVLADQEKVPGNRENYILQRHRDSSRHQAGKGGDAAQFTCESDGHDDGNHDPEDNAAQEQKLITAARISYVAEGSPSPKLRCANHNSKDQPQPAQTKHKALQFSLILSIDGCSPVIGASLINIKQDVLLPQRKQACRNLFVLLRQIFHLLALLIED